MARPHLLSAVILGASLAAWAAPAGAQSGADSAAKALILRNARYCEILPVRRDGLTLIASVYNTLGQNDCPQAQWEALTQDMVKTRFDAFTALLNGPRHFVMDRIIASGATAAGERIEIGGIGFVKRAQVRLSVLDLRGAPYHDREIERDTTYVFDAGQPTFQLTAPNGAVYVMQSYSRIKDPGLTYDALPGLGAKLSLPKGWSFAVQVPATDLKAGAAGTAVVVQDDLGNTYQRIMAGR